MKQQKPSLSSNTIPEAQLAFNSTLNHLSCGFNFESVQMNSEFKFGKEHNTIPDLTTKFPSKEAFRKHKEKEKINIINVFSFSHNDYNIPS